MNYLKHHGILGMKWGVRRYQNPDGTRTALGKKRERVGFFERNFPEKTDEQRYSEYKKRFDSKNRGALSDAELREKTNRLKMERELKSLTNEEIDPGRTAVKKMLGNISTSAITTIATTVAVGTALYFISRKMSGGTGKLSPEEMKTLGTFVANGGPKKK